MKKTFFVLSICMLFASCDVWNQIGGVYNLSQCDYKYNSITDIQLSGMNLGKGTSLSMMDIANIATVLSGVGKQTIPFNMTLNMDISNPNQSAAFLNALDYAVLINEMEFTTGKLDIPIRIEPGQTAKLPISMAVDLKELMNRYSQGRVAKEMRSFLGITSDKTDITVKLWPKVLVGNKPITSPAAIPVVFSFGGK